MDQDKLDQIFRNSLHDHKTSLDKEDLWNSIAAEQAPKRKYAYLLKVISVALVASVAFGVILANKNSQSIDTASSEVLNYSDDTLSKAPEAARPLSSKTVEKSTTVVNEETKKETPTNNETQTINKTKSNYRTSTKKKVAPSKTLTTSVTSAKSLVRTTTKNSSHTKIQQAKDETSGRRIPQQLDLILNLDNGTITNLSESSYALLSSAEQIEASNIKTLSHSRPTFQRKDKIECFDHRKKVDPFYLEAYTSVDVIKNRFTTDGSGDLSYLNERKATLTQLEGYRSGIRLKYLTRSGFYLKTGVEFGAIRERFNKSEKTERVEIWPNQLLETITQSDTTIYIYGDKPVTVIEEKSWKVWNTYKTLGIPIMAGYETDFGKLTFGVEMGAIYNLLYDFEGMLLDDSYTPAMDPDYFKSQINTSLTGGLSVGYRLTSKYKLQALCSFKHNLSTISSQFNPLQQSNSKIGLGLGIEMKL